MSLIPPAQPAPPLAAAVGRRDPGLDPRGATLRRSLVRRLVGGAAFVVLLLWSLLVVAWLTLHWAILPHIQQWRDPLAARVSRALGVAVTIGAIEVRTAGWVPSLELRDVVLADPAGRPGLRLTRVQAALSARSLLTLEWRLDQLLVDGPELEVRRDRSGRVHVAGFDVGGAGGAADPRPANWFFGQREFVIRGGAVRWIDEQRGAAPLTLTDVQLVVRNGLTTHALRLDATPPAVWGDRFTLAGRFEQPLFAPRGDWHRWSGQAYLDLPRADLRELRRHAELPFELTQGLGALRGWFDVEHGEAVQASVDFALRAVAVRVAPGLAPLAVEALEGRLEGRRRAETVELALRRLTFETADGARWPKGDLTFRRTQREGQPPDGGAFTAERLDIGQMARIAERLPLGAPLRQLLGDLRPQGALTGVDATWTGALDAPAGYRVRGRLERGALAARAGPVADEPGRPGVRGADIRFDATDRGGEARIELERGALELPGVFAEPLLPVDRLDARLAWSVLPPAAAGGPAAFRVEVRQARFANADASGDFTARWTTGATPPAAAGAVPDRGSASSSRPGPASVPPSSRTAAASAALDRADDRFPGHLELDARLTRANAARGSRYLPLGLPAPTRAYLGRALLGGRIVNAAFHVRGPLREFPFLDARRGQRGEFTIAARVEQAAFAYVPSEPGQPASPWPSLTQADVDLRLEGRTLTLASRKGRLAGLELQQVDATIRDFGGDPVLRLDGSVRAPLAEMLHLVNTTPVGRWTGQVLARASATGPAELRLGFTMPLDRVETTRVEGRLALAGNDVRVTPETPLLAAAHGAVAFTETGFMLADARVRVFGGDASLEGGTQAGGSVRFTGQGTVTAEGLRHAVELGPVARIAEVLDGHTKVKASLGFVRGEPDFSVTSDLVGMRIELPAPLAKAADAPLPLRVAQTVDAAATPLRDTLQVELGSLLQTRWQRELGDAAPRVLRGSIGLLQPAPALPADGVAAALTAPRLAADAWESVLERLFPDERPAASATPSRRGSTDPPRPVGETVRAAGMASPRSNPEARDSYAPDAIALATAELTYGSHRLTHLKAELNEAAGVWRTKVRADQLEGDVEFRRPQSRAGAGRLYARLLRLQVPKEDAPQVESLLDAQPAALPALDVIVDDFELRGRRLGRLQVQAVNRGGPEARDWQLSQLDLTMPEAHLTATGHWTAPTRNAARRTALDFTLRIADSGVLLDRLGTPGAVRGGKGTMSGRLGWTGSPFDLDYPTLGGTVGIALSAGQFLKAEPGAGRLLGVLSLQSLPRRLTLDFRDVFSRGFAFDSVAGDLRIAQGVAETDNLKMRGVQAVVLMEGRADLRQETQDLRVVVVPEINAGTAALAAAVVNPLLGLSTFLAQYVFKAPLTAATTREFHITGPWSDPQVAAVPRKLTDAVPAIAAEPASGAASNLR